MYVNLTPSELSGDSTTAQSDGKNRQLNCPINDMDIIGYPMMDMTINHYFRAEQSRLYSNYYMTVTS